MTWNREKKFCAAMIAITAVYIVAILIAHFAMPFDPNVTDMSLSLREPGQDGFALGSDNLGRDVLLRTLAGGTESVLISFAVVFIAFAIGCALGLAAGYLGGAVDTVISKVIVMFQAFPSFVLAIAIAAILGQGVFNMIIAIVAVYWTLFARLARNLAVSIKDSDSVKAARVCGARPLNIMRKYVLPNMTSPLIVMAALSVGDVILTMAGLSFLGLGPARPTNEWGAMMSEARSVLQLAPWCIIVPGCALFSAVIVFNLLGDSLRDVFDVRTQQAVEDASGGKRRYRSKGMGKGKERNMDKKRIRNGIAAALAAFALVGAMALGGCAQDGSSQATTDDGSSTAAAATVSAAPTTATPGVLRAGSSGYFYAESLDPANNWDGWELQYYGITENLLQLTDSFEVTPWLAQSVSNVNETTWQLVLRDGVMFSNGQPMTGDSVKACLERTIENNPRALETLPIASITAEGQTVTITTSNPVPAFENAICDPIFSIYYVGEGIDYATATPCTGPYMAAEFVGDPDYKIKMVPNPYYWNGAPKLTEVYLSTYFDEDAMVMAMQNGELDVLAMPPSSAFSLLSDTSKYTASLQTSTRADFIRFNMNHEVTANPAIREAISWCIDREGYASVICGGTEVPSYGIYSAQLPYGGTEGLNVTVNSHNLDRAAEVLDKAGIVDSDGDGLRELNGQPVTINLVNCINYTRFVSIADDLQSKLASIGITLNITPVDYWLQDAETYAKDNPDMTIDSYGMAPTGDASYFANMCFVTGGSANFGGYSNAQVDALVAQLNVTFDEAQRTALIKQIEQLVLDDNAYIFFSNSTTNYIATNNVSGYAVAPSEYYFVTVNTEVK